MGKMIEQLSGEDEGIEFRVQGNEIISEKNVSVISRSDDE